jgi:hypothetical protein
MVWIAQICSATQNTHSQAERPQFFGETESRQNRYFALDNKKRPSGMHVEFDEIFRWAFGLRTLCPHDKANLSPETANITHSPSPN